MTHGMLNQSMIKGDQLFGENGRGTLVNFFDLGNPSTHWARKEEAGRRMALAALDRVYGQKHLFTGPELVEGKINGAQVTCKFRYVGDGIQFVPSIDGISGVVIVDKKNGKHWAEVKVAAPDTIVVSAPKGVDIAAVYYGFHTNPHETLFNSDGLPAFSFNVGSVANLKSEDPAPMLQITAGGSDKIELHVSHVRREGYNFSVVENKAAEGAPVKVKAYIPSEWKGAEMIVDGKTSQLDKTMTDNGKKYVEVMAAVNGPQITVAEQGKGAELAKVKRP
jgi:sialate O-acetylesterase